MKRILLLALIFISLNAFGQGNLQFNQVLNIKNGDNYTVPAGKVLKITSVSSDNKVSFKVPFTYCDQVSYSQYRCVYDINAPIICKIGNLNFSINSGQPQQALGNGYQSVCSSCPSTYDYSYGGFSVITPIWLKAGENITIAQGSGVFISAIEFNIIP